ncbi:hypothetical protein LRP88_04157 [Fusarium phalaenopsidis]
MVQFLRPWGGMKRVWVDAICINQGDDEERNAQVSKMASIYLGSPRQRLEDVVLPHTHNGDAEELGFYKLLGRRYFGRIWIIQELILPRQVVIPVEDGEWWADHITGSSLPSWLQENSPVPWIENIAQGGLTGKDIYELVRATWSSKASDPRDRVFGVLALQDSSALRPDYSLSRLHVFMGLFAHSLIILKHLEVLSSAKVVVQFTTEWSRAKDNCELARDTRIRDIEWVQAVPSKHFVNPLAEEEIHELKRQPWHRNATIDSATGNLKINLIHLIGFSSKPITVGKDEVMSIFEVEAIGVDASMYLVTDVPLNQLIEPGKDHLFLLDDGSETSFVFLILRDAGNKGALPMFKLIGCCYQLYFHVYADS